MHNTPTRTSVNEFIYEIITNSAYVKSLSIRIFVLIIVSSKSIPRNIYPLAAVRNTT